MSSRLSRKAVLASLFTTGSALVAGGEAHADVIVTNVNQNISFTNGIPSLSYPSTTLPGAMFSVKASNGPTAHILGVVRGSGHFYVKATTHILTGFVQVVSAGKKWSTIN